MSHHKKRLVELKPGDDSDGRPQEDGDRGGTRPTL